MAQHDYVIANQGAAAARADLNALALAIATKNADGATEPATTYANMEWYQESTNLLKVRNEANDAWIDVAYFDQSNGFMDILDNTQISTTGGVTRGQLGSPSLSNWKLGTDDTEYLIAPDVIKPLIEHFSPRRLVEETTIADQAEYVTPVFSSDAKAIVIEFDNVIPATNAVDLRARTTATSAAPYDAGSSDYQYALDLIRVDAANGSAKSSGSNFLYISGGVGNGTDEGGASGSMFIHNPLAAVPTHMRLECMYQNNGSDLRVLEGAMFRKASATLDRVQFYFSSSSNIQSGKFRVYEII